VIALARTQSEFIDALFAAPGAALSPGLEIYRRNVLSNLAGALAAAFPVVRRLVGDAFFEEAAACFARASPSRSGDLHEYGGAFDAFLEGYAPARVLAYLPDVARLEWACHESQYAVDAPPLDFVTLGGVAPDRLGELRFTLHPAARLLRSAHPVVAIWDANQPERDGTPRRVAGPDCVVVQRAHRSVRVERVDAGEWELLAALADGASLEQASAALAPDEAERVLATSLARFVREGVICGFTLPAARR
jgi:hypothetical protein